MPERPRGLARVFNERGAEIDESGLADFLQKAMMRLEACGETSVLLTDDARMREFNRRFRGQDAPTDVLSFPHQADAWEDDSYLGDIAISVETAERQRESTLDDELKLLSLHGLLHLMGHDHEVDQGEMDSLEQALRKELLPA